MDGSMIDSFMVLFSLIYNAVLILVFVLRGKGQRRLEAKLGPIFNALRARSICQINVFCFSPETKLETFTPTKRIFLSGLR